MERSPRTDRRANVTIVPDAATLAAATADHAIAVLARTLSGKDRAHIALAGGSTPRAVNALLVAEPRRSAVDWTRVVFWFGDERCVPPDDAGSNYRMNRETLLDPLGIAPVQIRRMHGEDQPESAAAQYDAALVSELGELPHLDLILLGMGPDGHTASLFPGTVAAIGPGRRCIAHFVPKLSMWRMTLTPAALNAAHHVAISAGGAEKADALHAVLDGPFQPDRYPSQLVAPSDGELRWFADAAAAANLEATGGG